MWFVSKLLFVASSLQTVASAAESVFAQEGSSVTLVTNIPNSLIPNHIFWVFNQTHEVVWHYPHYPKHRQLRIAASYQGRVEFNSTTFSLELKTVMMSDSGLYRIEIGVTDGDAIAEYRLSVLEPVISPVMTVLSYWSSSECNVTLSCRGHLCLTFTCNSSNCTVVEGVSNPTLMVFIKDDLIICNHSNQVSWSHVTLKLEQYCSAHKAGGVKYHYISVVLWIRISIGLLIVVGSSAVLCYCFIPKRPQNLQPIDKEEPPQSSTQQSEK